MQYDPNQQPYQPMQPPRKKRGVLFWLLVIGLPVLLVCALCSTLAVIASRSASSPSTVIGTATPIPTEAITQQDNATPTPNQPITFKVGQTVSTEDGFIVTVNKVYTSPGDGNFNIPSKGNQYLIIDVSTKNNTGSVQHMAEIQFTLSDASGQPLDSTFVDMPGVHDYTGGVLQNGATLRGQLVYEVPTGKHNYTFTFQGDLTGTSQTMWDIHS